MKTQAVRHFKHISIFLNGFSSSYFWWFPEIKSSGCAIHFWYCSIQLQNWPMHKHQMWCKLMSVSKNEPQILATQCGWWTRGISSRGSLIERQNPRSHPRPLNQKLHPTRSQRNVTHFNIWEVLQTTEGLQLNYDPEKYPTNWKFMKISTGIKQNGGNLWFMDLGIRVWPQHRFLKVNFIQSGSSTL